MPEPGASPMELFAEGETELLERMATYRQAREQQTALEENLAKAKTRTAKTANLVDEHGLPLLERIHDSVTEDTDPGEYLQAILNTHNSGQRKGDEVAARLAPMREQVRQRAIPIGIVGSTVGQVILGLSAGDIKVRRKQEQETGFDTALGIRLQIPLLSRISTSGSSSFDEHPHWDYRGNWQQPYDVDIVQDLRNLRIAGNLGEVQAFNETPPAVFRRHDTLAQSERDIKYNTGFVPFIAYGEGAVSGLLSALHEGREIVSHAKPPLLDDVAATAISLGIAPEKVTDTNPEALKTRLRTRFVDEVTSSVRATVRQEASRRQFPNHGGLWVDWRVAASPEVMNYVGVEQDEITDAVRIGIEKSIDVLRVDDEADKRSWINPEDAEYRLLQDEAREKAVGLIATRYDLVIDPADLQSETLNQRLAERLEVKREEKARHDEFRRKNSHLYATT